MTVPMRKRAALVGFYRKKHRLQLPGEIINGHKQILASPVGDGVLDCEKLLPYCQMLVSDRSATLLGT